MPPKIFTCGSGHKTVLLMGRASARATNEIECATCGYSAWEYSDRENIEWLLGVLDRIKLLSHGEECRKLDRAKDWLRYKLGAL